MDIDRIIHQLFSSSIFITIVSASISGTIPIIINKLLKKDIITTINKANNEFIEYLSFEISSRKISSEENLQEIKFLIAYKYKLNSMQLFPLSKAFHLAAISNSCNPSIASSKRKANKVFFQKNEQKFNSFKDIDNKKESYGSSEFLKLYLLVLCIVSLLIINTIFNLELPYRDKDYLIIFLIDVLYTFLPTTIVYSFFYMNDCLEQKYGFRSKVKNFFNKHWKKNFIALFIILLIYLWYLIYTDLGNSFLL